MLRLEVMISALPDRSISYFISLWFVVVSPSGLHSPHSFYCTEAKEMGCYFSRQHSIGVSRIFIQFLYLTLSPTATSATSSCDKSDMSQRICLLFRDNGAQWCPLHSPGWLMPQAFSPYHYAVMLGFLSGILSLPGP